MKNAKCETWKKWKMWKMRHETSKREKKWNMRIRKPETYNMRKESNIPKTWTIKKNMQDETRIEYEKTWNVKD